MRPTPVASIRLRITAIAVIAVAGVLVVASTALVAVQRRQLTSSVDAALAQRADDLTSLMASASSVPEVLTRSQQEGFAQVVGETGVVIAATMNLDGEPALPVGYQIGDAETIQNVDGFDFDQDVFRVLGRTVYLDGEPAELLVGTTFDVVSGSLRALARALELAVPFVVLIVAMLVWWLVGRTLSPVEAIRAEVAEIGARDLDRRVPAPRYRDEIGLLAETMNQMLDRVEGAVERQQRFVADASHELRSPLTRMRAEIEVGLESPDVADAVSIESLHEEVVALQLLVDNLLHLAGADAVGHARLDELVDLDDIVLREASRLRDEGKVTVDMSGVSGAQVRGDRHQLARAVRNLCDNAGRYATALVTVGLGERGGSAVLTVADDGPGIPRSEAEKVFERFGRLDSARRQSTGGAGLGLAIVKDIVERHDGLIVIDPEYRDGARFVVTIPLA